MNNLIALLQQETSDMNSTLDLGCGDGRFTKRLNLENYLGVDIYQPELDELKLTHNVVQLDITNLSIFVDKSFDCVMAVDVVEHLKKKDALNLIVSMERIARKKVIIVTPEGYLEQTPYESGMDPSEYQRHLTGFSLEELKHLGYRLLDRIPGDDIHNRKWNGLFVVKEFKWNQ